MSGIKCFLIPHILHDNQYIPEASPSIGETYPTMSQVEWDSKFEPPPQGALLQSEILFLGAFFLNGGREQVVWR
jgi:hypothetical protein